MAAGVLINLLVLAVAHFAGAASTEAAVSWRLDDFPSEISSKLDSGSNAAARFATDFGGVTRAASPAAVFHPSTADDIAALLHFAYCSESPFPVAARGNGHSVRGQAFVAGGVAVDMAALGGGGKRRINVSSAGMYVDAGGEQLWIDVLEVALQHGLSPRSWTDYLYLTVGGTLSNAGISGQVFRHGPQISNVYELDVVTGKGEMITCSSESNRDLFYGVLGGLGQLGVITRARISLRPAPARVRWLRLFYTDLGNLTRDQEFLISLPDPTGFDYVEGQVLLSHQRVESSTFYSNRAVNSINRLMGESNNAIYFLEGAVYYDSPLIADQKIEELLKQLNFVPGLVFSNDVTYLEFLNRVHIEIQKQSSSTVLLHPWLNLFLPKSRIRDFQVGVFEGILQNLNLTGLVLLYPLNKHRWDDTMTATVPDEEVFYTVGFLWSATEEDWGTFDALNSEILGFCDQSGIEVKQYLPHYTSKLDWVRHFGLVKWEKFVQLKRRYDPKAVLSPGQQIFTTQVNTQEGNACMHAKL